MYVCIAYTLDSFNPLDLILHRKRRKLLLKKIKFVVPSSSSGLLSSAGRPTVHIQSFRFG